MDSSEYDLFDHAAPGLQYIMIRAEAGFDLAALITRLGNQVAVCTLV